MYFKINLLCDILASASLLKYVVKYATNEFYIWCYLHSTCSGFLFSFRQRSCSIMFIFAHSFIPKMYLSNVENIRSGHQHSFLLYFLGTQETVLLTILPLVKLSTNSGQWIVNGGDLNHFLPEAVKYPCMKTQPLLFLQQ